MKDVCMIDVILLVNVVIMVVVQIGKLIYEQFKVLLLVRELY